MIKSFIVSTSSLFAIALTLAATTSITPLILLTALNLLLKENFPFSHFPMYASFSDFTYYIYVTDNGDQPIAMKSNFGVTAQFIRKLFDTEVRRRGPGRKKMSALTVDDMRQAGEVALNYLLGQSLNVRDKPLRLYRMGIILEEGTVIRKPMLIAEHKSDS